MRVYFAGTPYASHEHTLIAARVRHRLLTYNDGAAVVRNTLRKWLEPRPEDARVPTGSERARRGA